MTTEKKAEEKKLEQLKEQIEKTTAMQYQAKGEFVRLRPVHKSDLKRLAVLLRQCPSTMDNPQPWTEERLRESFEDKKEPGLWSRNGNNHTFVAIDENDLMVGLIESTSWDRKCFEITFHIDESLENVDELGIDLLKTYLELRQNWFDPVRVEAYILSCETKKQDWLLKLGFLKEIAIEDYHMFKGNLEALEIWGWLAERFREQ